jgi:hypothetical protein
MVRGLALVVIGTAGCLIKPSPPEPQVAHCSAGTFGIAQPFADPDKAFPDYDSTLPIDGLELWFSSPVLGPAHVFFLSRSTPSDPFQGTPKPAPFNVGNEVDTDPSITGDGLRIIYRSSNGPGGDHAWEITRTSRSVPFGDAATLARGLETTNVHSLDIALDGKRLYFTDNIVGALYVATRDTLTGAFGTPVMLIPSGVAFPSISPDELEVFYQPLVGGFDVLKVVRRVRASPSGDFGEEINVFNGAGDPEMGADSRTLYMSKDNAFSTITRDCP